ncbi:MAG: dihydrolipoyl dehydrogenase [Bifidobacteriaceae bacterium]|nr:dihydrolipoyl dehydrogenase [Bifidobacteriaceae bacterium]
MSVTEGSTSVNVEDPAPAGPFDVIVLGAGSGGYATALRSAELGLSVALVEADRIGGTCLNRGCVPTKALLQAAHVADEIREANRLGVDASLNGVDPAALHAFKRSVVDRMHKGLTGLIGQRGITVVPGHGDLVSPSEVRVGQATLAARRAVVLAMGARPRPFAAAAGAAGRVLDSNRALELERVPASIAVLGGGVIGVEFASLWRSLGAEVTLVEALPHLLSHEDVSCSKQVERQFKKRGIRVKLGAAVEDVVETAQDVTLRLAGQPPVTAEYLLVAVGRDANLEGAGLARAGVATAGGLVRTDAVSRTTAPGVWAVGDITAGPQLAHRAFGQGIAVAERIAGREVPPSDLAGVPRIAYCDPEVASVGLTEQQALERFGPDGYRAVEQSLMGNARSLIQGAQGIVKVIRRTDGPIVGVHIVGRGAGELIAEPQAWVAWEAMPEEVAELIHAHPTQGEALGEACLSLAGKPLHQP